MPSRLGVPEMVAHRAPMPPPGESALSLHHKHLLPCRCFRRSR
ncbi:hypothetical protein HMPREF1549_01220 [Actinomyces johnsonii F0510]|uniref:Uncharacterized protein n=1 Tax=Actinomyces johnsonii F0510 TaxID=1227262 RepID=U1RPT1_9ACTO|nr:hypothetical protein HMPREF1549_01220 [Actinomyces johnsonii F0510]